MWGFLGALGNVFAKGAHATMGGLQTAGKAIGQGVQTGVREVAQIPQKLGKLGRPGPEMARTPGFNPSSGTNASPAFFQIRAPLTEGANIPAQYMPSLTGVPDFVPQNVTQLPVQQVPRVLPAPVKPMTYNPALGPVPRADAPIAPPANISQLRKQDVPVPQLPGRPGGPQAYDPETSARYDYVMEGADWQDGKPQFKRNWKDVLRNAGIGFAQGYSQTGDIGGGLGGALAGGVGTAISPMAGREFSFDTMEAPRMRAQRERQLERQGIETAAERDQLQTERLRGEIADRNAKLERDKREDKWATEDRDWDLKTRDARLRAQRYKAAGGGVLDVETGEWIQPQGGTAGMSPRDERMLRNDMDRDIAAFEKQKLAAGNRKNKNAKQDMQAHAITAQRLKDKYGDLIEVGQQGGWYYVKPRLGATAPTQELSRPENSLPVLR